MAQFIPRQTTNLSPAPPSIVEARPDNLIPARHIVTTSPVQDFSGAGHGRQLPLSLILLITSYLDSPADISRVTRSSKLLYYLNLPKLYEDVVLYSYPEIRYRNERAEGFGGGSPFTMALDGLISGKAGAYVRSFRLVGMSKEMDMDDYEKGRVPDNNMLLNIAIKAAMEKMDKLRAFSWELNSKPLRTIYQGLSLKHTLASLTIKFPTTRDVRPTVLVPPIPNLTFIHLIDMDPLCFPDDFSVLFANARKLQDLKMEWNPRMIQEKEAISLDAIFDRCVAANVKLPVKRLAVKNLYAPSNSSLNRVIDSTSMESVTIINCETLADSSAQFYDDSWLLQDGICMSYQNFKKFRVDVLDRRTRLPLAEFGNFEEIYFVNQPPGSPASTPDATVRSNSTTPTDRDTQVPSIESPSERLEIGSTFLAAIITRHGSTLKKLLLSDRWCLSGETIRNLLKSCPNLRQLGLALDSNDFKLLRNVIALAPNLRAIRILIRPDEPIHKVIGDIPAEQHAVAIGMETWRPEYKNLKWLSMGPHRFELGGVFRDTVTKGFRRKVVGVTWEQIKHVEIFGMDCADI